MEMGREEVCHGEMAVVVVGQMVPHSYVVGKNQEGYFGSERSQPQARPHSPGFQHWEDRSLLSLTGKPSGHWGDRRNSQIFAT